MITRYISIIILTSILQACGGSSEKESTRTDTLTYSMYKAESRSDYRRNASDTEGTFAVIWYPNFKQGGDTALINKVINEQFTKEYRGNDIVFDPASAAMVFVMKYDSLTKQLDTYSQYWKRDINMRVVYQKYPYVALKTEFSEYTGGAHGIYGSNYINFDRKKNRLITLDDLFSKEEIKELTTKAEAIFRAQEGLKEGDNYSNYFFENGIFVLPTNFSLRKEGILFHYGLYEIKPYVSGITEIFVPIEY